MRPSVLVLGASLLLCCLVPGGAARASVPKLAFGRTDQGARPRVDLWIAEAPPGAEVLGVFGRITGSGQADRLISVSADGVRSIRMHAMVRGPRGGAMMRPVEGLAVPARQSVRLNPDGLHLMLSGPVQPLRAGKFLRMRLGFARSGVMVVRVPVRRRD